MIVPFPRLVNFFLRIVPKAPHLRSGITPLIRTVVDRPAFYLRNHGHVSRFLERPIGEMPEMARQQARLLHVSGSLDANFLKERQS